MILAAILLLTAATSIVVINTTIAVALLISVTLLVAMIATTFPGLIRARSALAIAEQQRKIATLEAAKAAVSEKNACQRQQEAEQQTAQAKASRDFLMDVLSSADPHRVGNRIVKISDLDAAAQQISEKFKDILTLNLMQSTRWQTPMTTLAFVRKPLISIAKPMLAHQLPASASEGAILRSLRRWSEDYAI